MKGYKMSTLFKNKRILGLVLSPLIILTLTSCTSGNIYRIDNGDSAIVPAKPIYKLTDEEAKTYYNRTQAAKPTEIYHISSNDNRIKIYANNIFYIASDSVVFSNKIFHGTVDVFIDDTKTPTHIKFQNCKFRYKPIIHRASKTINNLVLSSTDADVFINRLSKNVIHINDYIDSYTDIVRTQAKPINYKNFTDTLLFKTSNLNRWNDFMFNHSTYKFSLYGDEYEFIRVNRLKEDKDSKLAPFLSNIDKIYESIEKNENEAFLLAIMKTVPRTIKYDRNYIHTGVMEAFENNKTTCNGYAKIVDQLLRKKFKEENVVLISGKVNRDNKSKEENLPEYHIWNMVKINDRWIHIDVSNMIITDSDEEQEYFVTWNKTIYPKAIRKEGILLSAKRKYPEKSILVNMYNIKKNPPKIFNEEYYLNNFNKFNLDKINNSRFIKAVLENTKLPGLSDDGKDTIPINTDTNLLIQLTLDNKVALLIDDNKRIE